MKKSLYYISLISLLLVTACSKKEAPKIDKTKHVDVQLVKSYDVPYVYDYPALVQGVVDYPVLPRVSGAIFKQYYTEGTYVKKDTPLYQIDPRPFELDLQNAQGQLLRDKASLDNYKLIYERYMKLYKLNAVAQQDTEQATINYQTAVGNVKTDEAMVNQAKLSLEYSIVRAPADGYIAERQVTVGEMVTAYQTTMNRINSVNDLYITFSMPENDRLTIQNGGLDGILNIPQAFKFRIDIQLADGTMIRNAGYVQFTDTRISIANGVWNMRAYVDNTKLKNSLLAGQFVHVYLNGLSYKNSYSIPQEAVFRDDKGPFVYIVKDNKIVKQRIVTGPMNGEDWIIKGGLTDKLPVVISGGVKVQESDNVTIDTQTQQKNEIALDNKESIPVQETPLRADLSVYKSDSKVRRIQIESSAQIYSGQY